MPQREWETLVPPDEAARINDALFDFVALGGPPEQLTALLVASNDHELGHSLGYQAGMREAYLRNVEAAREAGRRRSWWQRVVASSRR